MKNFIASVLVLSTFAFASCKKTEVAPTPRTSAQINVEYRVQSESGHFTVDYVAPQGNQLVEKQYQIDRTNYSYSFTYTNGNDFKIKAFNSVPSQRDVQVTILINGVVFKFAEANAPGAEAVAEGIY